MAAQKIYAYVVNEANTVIVSSEGSTLDARDKTRLNPWSKRVAEEFGPAQAEESRQVRVVFVWCDAGKWSASKVSQGKHSAPNRGDLELAAACLARERRLNAGDRVVFGREMPSGRRLLSDMNVVVRSDRPNGTQEEVLTVKGMEAWVKQQNTNTVPQIEETLRSATGVIPFLGAGISAPFRYPVWGEFFKRFVRAAAAGNVAAARKLTLTERDGVIAFVATEQFEEAADILMKWDQDAFYTRIKQEFGNERDRDRTKRAPLDLLPLIAAGPIITTNVDPVIEAHYKELGKPFSNDLLIPGARKHPTKVVTALQQNSSALIKLHGDAVKPDELIFAKVEYEDGYGEMDNPGPVERLSTVIYTNRPLLFLGCSLKTDRTFKSLKRVYEWNHFVGHYAVLDAPFGSRQREERVKQLSAAGIRPLWYPPGKFEDIYALLEDLVSRTASDEIIPEPLVIEAVEPDDEQPVQWPDVTEDHIRSVTEALVAGNLIFFLGAAVHPDRMHGREFYEQICRQAKIPWPSRDRSDAAQYVADIDRSRLSVIVRDLVQTHYTQPCQAHRFVARLAKLKQLKRSSLMIITTNYDTMTEAAFDAAGVKYHLFLYNHYGLHAGRFLHRRPDGREFAIRTPAAIREPLDAPAIVKLNGGIDPLGHWRDTFVVASSDFEELSTRLPDVLPEVVWRAIKDRSILFLGHGLREPDVRSLMRRRNRESPPNSWAVLLGKTDVPYWQAGGIKLIEADLNDYLDRLEDALTASLQRSDDHGAIKAKKDAATK